jgi:steroid delta-isomerase-like uncharacterized protein
VVQEDLKKLFADQGAPAQLVQRWIEAFNAHDAQRIVALYAEDAELYDSGMRRVRRGKAEITRWFTLRFQQMPGIQYLPGNFFLRENEAVISWIAQGKTPALLRQRWLSRPFQVEGVSVFRIQPDVIVWQHGYYDHLHVAESVLPFLRWLPLKL